MTQSVEIYAGGFDSPFLLIADHASAHVPDDIDLGIDASLFQTHIALDIGAAELGKSLCDGLACPGIFGAVSRLVIDLNREEDAPHIVPATSDGHAIPGNHIGAATVQSRIDQYWKPYHDQVANEIEQRQPSLLISLHSFTPQLATRPEEQRPWEIGILYNEDDRAARLAIPMLERMGAIVGDQQPYSGKLLNATMNRHGEANGIPYLGIEMRQDLIADPAGVAQWSNRLQPVIRACLG